jgi:hypothetical protein
MSDDKKEVEAREVRRKAGTKDGHKAYRDPKAWDFGRVGTEQVVDTSRLMERHENAKKARKKAKGRGSGQGVQG